MSNIFVSHSSKDNESAKEFRDWLREEGHVSYFLDFEPDNGLVAGKRWEDELFKNLRFCRAVIALVSPHWLASRWCFAEVTQARAAGKCVFFAKITPCDTSGLFSEIQHVDLSIDRVDAYRRLARGLKEIGLDPRDSFPWDGSRPPYPGLLAFQENDASIFFGRDKDIQRGLELLDRQKRTRGAPFILCLGASGSGKSSLVRAGLIPRLRKDQDAWLALKPFRPQKDPVEELAITLAEAFRDLGKQEDWKQIYDHLLHAATSSDLVDKSAKNLELQRGLSELARDLRVLAGKPDATVLLTLDQAEELFGFSDAIKSHLLLLCLRQALGLNADRLMLIATIRSDTLGSFQTHPDLQDFAYEPLTIDPILLRDLPQIIEGPARLADITLEPGLVQSLVADAVTGDALPLLAFTLRELYERHGKDGNLSIKEYDELGRLEGSVRRAADAVIEAMSPSTEEMVALKAAFVPAMVRVTEEGVFARQRASWLDLPVRAHRVLQRFVDDRLLISRGEGGERVVEVAHEALLRVWPQLTQWIREDAESLRTLSELLRAAHQWEVRGRGQTWLVHRGDRLKVVEVLMLDASFAEHMDSVAQSYVKACTRKHQRTKILRYVTGLIGAIAVGATGYGWYQSTIATTEHTTALIAESMRLASVSRELTDKGFVTAGMLLALEALPKTQSVDRPSVPAAEAALLHAIFEQREMKILSGHHEAVNKVQFSTNGSSVVTASRDGTARKWSISTGKTESLLDGRAGSIDTFDFSPVGDLLVTGSAENKSILWSLTNGTESSQLPGQSGRVSWVKFSPNGEMVVTVSANSIARVWNTRSTKVIATLTGHKGEIYQALFSQDGTRIVTASDDRTARVWDIASTGLTGTPIVLRGHEDRVSSVQFCKSDATRIVTGSWDKTARLWNAVTGTSMATLQGHDGGIERVTFSPDCTLLATASVDGTVRLWSGLSGKLTGVLRGHRGQVYDADFSADGLRLVTVADDGTARLWDLSTQEIIAVLAGHSGTVWSGSFSPDGSLIATAGEDTTARLWSARPNLVATTLMGHIGPVYKANFSGDGEKLATISKDGTARIWTGFRGKLIAELKGHTDEVWHVAFSADSQFIVTASNDGTARLWNANSGRAVVSLTGHKGWVGHASFSPDGRSIVTGSKDKSARVWNVTNGATRLILAGHEGPVNLAEFSGNGQWIVTASDDNTARIWDANTGRLVHKLSGHLERVTYAAFTPDSSKVVTTSKDKMLRLWDAKIGDLLAVLQGHTDQVLSAAFSPDGRYIVSTSWDNTAIIWDTKEKKALFVLFGHEGRVVDASFSPDGRLVATAGWDGTARVWHVKSGQLVSTLRGHNDLYVVSVTFSRDGQYLVTTSWDKTAKLWRLPVRSGDDWLAYARENAPRQLTDNERKLYISK